MAVPLSDVTNDTIDDGSRRDAVGVGGLFVQACGTEPRDHALRGRLQFVGVIGDEAHELGAGEEQQESEHEQDQVRHDDHAGRGGPARPAPPLERVPHGVADDDDDRREDERTHQFAREIEAREGDHRRSQADEHAKRR